MQTTYNPDGTSVSASYYPGGQKYQHIDENGTTISHYYYANDLSEEIKYPTGTNTYFYYDAGNRQTEMDDSSGRSTWSYDNDNRTLTQVSRNGSVNYSYDAAGRRQTMTVPGTGTGPVVRLFQLRPSAHSSDSVAEYDFLHLRCG